MKNRRGAPSPQDVHQGGQACTWLKARASQTAGRALNLSAPPTDSPPSTTTASKTASRGKDIQYPERQLLGITDADIDRVEDALLKHLTKRGCVAPPHCVKPPLVSANDAATHWPPHEHHRATQQNRQPDPHRHRDRSEIR
ncbi:phage virion morphogenesis protein [Aeromonas molluscorum]|uniref:phage virion morphogenesis protein n=1 Tax=Aeromonas molluscorum TaxID=271417 RepID=UPI003F196200